MVFALLFFIAVGNAYAIIADILRPTMKTTRDWFIEAGFSPYLFYNTVITSLNPEIIRNPLSIDMIKRLPDHSSAFQAKRTAKREAALDCMGNVYSLGPRT